MYEKIINMFSTLSDKKHALQVVYQTERVISRYLMTITLINIGLGVCIGLAMWAVGMPTPYLWGAVATLLNFLPVVGAVIGVAAVGVVALGSLDSIALAVMAPLSYIVFTAAEGNFITPAILGRRLELNPVIIIFSVAVWGFLWGVIGVLVAVPILIIAKILCDQFEVARPVSEFLSGARERGT